MDKVVIKKRTFCKEDLLLIGIIITLIIFFSSYFTKNDVFLLCFLVVGCSSLLWIIYHYIYSRITDRESSITVFSKGITFCDVKEDINETHYWTDVKNVELCANQGRYLGDWFLEIHLKSSTILCKYVLDEFISDPIILKRSIEVYFDNVKITKGTAMFVWNWGKYELANKGIYKD